MALLDVLMSIGQELQVKKEVQIGGHRILVRSLTTAEYMDSVNFANEVASYGTLAWMTAWKLASLSNAVTQIDDMDFGASDRVDTGVRDRNGISETMQKSVFVRKALQAWPLDTIENIFACYLLAENEIMKFNKDNIKYEGKEATGDIIRAMDQQLIDMAAAEAEEKKSAEVFTKDEQRDLVTNALQEAIAGPVN